MLVSNLVAILSSAFIVIATGLLYPDNYDWATTRALSSIADASTHTQLAEEGKGLEVHESVAEEDEEEEEVERIEREECDPVRLQAARRLVMRWGVGGSVLLMVVWPAIAMALGASYFVDDYMVGTGEREGGQKAEGRVDADSRKRVGVPEVRGLLGRNGREGSDHVC